MKQITAVLFLSLVFAPLVSGQQESDAPRAAPVGVGDVAPDFTLEDQGGRRRTLSAERGQRPVVLVFYRGYW